MKKYFILLAILLFAGNIPAQQNTYEFLRLDMSARAAALGGSFVSNNDDPEVIFYNPAGMQMLEDNPVSFSYVSHFADIKLASLSFSTEFMNLGRFGAAVKYINYGSFTEADEFGQVLGEYSVNEVAFIAGYANSLMENLFYGANVKFIYSSIADRYSTGLGVDVGLNYNIPSQEMNIGLSVLNAGAQLSSYYTTKEDLPLDITLGISKKLEHLPLRVLVDFHKLNEDRENFFQKFKAFSVGAEFTLSRVLTLRLGYNNERREEMKIGSFAGLAGFNVGLGVQISKYRFDYGFSSYGLIGGLHRIGVSTSFD